jgi:hypothetical protein
MFDYAAVMTVAASESEPSHDVDSESSTVRTKNIQVQETLGLTKLARGSSRVVHKVAVGTPILRDLGEYRDGCTDSGIEILIVPERCTASQCLSLRTVSGDRLPLPTLSESESLG